MVNQAEAIDSLSLTTARSLRPESKIMDHDDLPSSLSVFSSVLSGRKMDINLDPNEIRILEEAAQENEPGQRFVTAIELVSWKHVDLHVMSLVETFRFPESGDTLLHVAVRNGKKEAVKFILDLVPSLLTTKNAVGETVWHVIASTGHLDVFICLLFYKEEQNASKISNTGVTGCDLLEQNIDGNTALHVALINHQEEIAMTLCKMNSKLCNVLNNENRSATYLAASVGCIYVLKTMPWSDSESVAKEVASAAIIGKQLDVLRYIKSGFETFFSTPYDLKKALHLAVDCGFVEGVEFFSDLYCKEVGSDMPKEENLQQNILHLAALGKDVEMVSYILNKKAFEVMIREQDKEGNTPLHLAAMNCRFMATYSLAWHPKADLALLNDAGLNVLEAAELFTRNFFSFSKWLTLSTLRAAGMRSSSPSRPEYPTKSLPNSATYNLSESTRKQVISILVVMLIVVAVSAFVFILSTSYIGPAYNLTKSRRLRLAAFCDMITLLISIISTPTLILLHDSKYLQIIIFKFAVPFLKISVTSILVQVVVILYMAVRYLDWPKSLIPGTTLCLLGLLLSPFIPLSLPELPFQRGIVRSITCHPLRLLLTLCHFIRQ